MNMSSSCWIYHEYDLFMQLSNLSLFMNNIVFIECLGLGGVPLIQRSRTFMGALDARAQRAASDAQTAARMTNGARDNVCAVGLPLLRGDSMRTWCGRNVMLTRRPRARRFAD